MAEGAVMANATASSRKNVRDDMVSSAALNEIISWRVSANMKCRGKGIFPRDLSGTHVGYGHH